MDLRKPTSMLVQRSQFRNDIIKQLAQWCSTADLRQPVSLHREQLPMLAKSSFVVTEKSDGIGYLLFLSRYTDTGEPFSVLLDRDVAKGNQGCIFQLEVQAPETVFQGSLFDGELVRDHRGFLKYLCFNTLAIAGESLRGANFMVRYTHSNRVFMGSGECQSPGLSYQAGRELALAGKICALSEPQRLLFLVSKPFLNLTDLGCLIRTPLSHDSDGLLFTPTLAGVAFKYKTYPTIDTLVVDGKHHVLKQDKLCLLEDSWQCRFVAEHGDSVQESAQAFVVESKVTLDKSFFVCTLHRVRVDKTQPNQWSTVADIFREVEEHLTLSEILEHLRR